MQESGATHARRMVMSLAIYIVLLFLFVWLPTAMFKRHLPSTLPVQLRLFYMVPQLQVPLELVIFHLSVLAFLERFKNRIGELQHVWLVHACRVLGLTRYLLPLPRIGDRDNQQAQPHQHQQAHQQLDDREQQGAGVGAGAEGARGAAAGLPS